MLKRLEDLKTLGLGDHESLVYDCLLSNSPSSATYIAKKCNLSRSSVYTTLNILISKGLVATSFKNETKQFSAEDYSSLEEMLKNEKENINDKFKILDELKKNSISNETESFNVPNILIFEGQEGLKKIYLSMMRQAPKNSTLFLVRDEFVWDKDWSFVFEENWHERVKKIKQDKNIKTKLIINNSKIEKAKSSFYKSKKALDYTFLSKNHSLDKFAIYIIADMVSILSIENNNLTGIKITNKHIAENFKNIFLNLW